MFELGYNLLKRKRKKRQRQKNNKKSAMKLTRWREEGDEGEGRERENPESQEHPFAFQTLLSLYVCTRVQYILHEKKNKKNKI